MGRRRDNAGKSGKKRGRGGAGQNRAESEAFLARNRNKPDVVVTASGLQYTVRDPGTGAQPGEDSTIEVNQRILLVGGPVIKDTFHGTETDIFSMREAIDGLKEGLPLMREGGRFRFVVPAELAWGKRGAGDRIGPYAALIFDIRLEKVMGEADSG